MPKNKIIITDDPPSKVVDTPEIRQKKLDWFKKVERKLHIGKTAFIEGHDIYDDILESQREVGEVSNLDRDDPGFDLPGNDVGDK
jgi:hypothetical protein